MVLIEDCMPLSSLGGEYYKYLPVLEQLYNISQNIPNIEQNRLTIVLRTMTSGCTSPGFQHLLFWPKEWSDKDQNVTKYEADTCTDFLIL